MDKACIAFDLSIIFRGKNPFYIKTLK